MFIPSTDFFPIRYISEITDQIDIQFIKVLKRQQIGGEILIIDIRGIVFICIITIIMPNLRECQICLFVYPGLPYRECDLCEVKYHQICYFQHRPRSELNCQACAHVMEQNMGRKQKMQPICSICNKSNGVMKQIPGDKFVHVLCALTSKSICIETYKQFKIYEKKQLPIDQCHECSKMSSHLLSCQFCQYKAHKECLPSGELYVGQDLQGNLKYTHNLLNFLLNLGFQSQTLSLILKCRKAWTKMPQSKFKRLVVCEREVKKYSWCFCGNPDLNNQQQNPSVICDGCNRFCHLSCTGMKDPKQIKSYLCPGCKCVDKFNKLSRFSDNIIEAIRLESVQLSIPDLRQLDAFPFVYSNKIKKNLGNHLDDVVIYLAVKAIEQMASENNQQNIIPEDFYNLLRIVLDQKGKITRNSKQLWIDYRQFIRKKDSEKTVSFFKLKPPQYQGLTEQATNNLIESKVTPCLKKIKIILQSNYIAESLSDLVNSICQIRKIVRQYGKVRDMIQKNLKGNLLLAFFVFKSASITEQKIVETLISHFILKNKITSKDYQQLNSTKRKKCPNFQTQDAWKFLTESIKITQPNKMDQIGDFIQQSKVSNKLTKQQENQLILATILSNRIHNPRLFNILKKKVQNFTDNTSLTQRQKKIKACYQWSLITKKLHFGIERKKISINSIIDLHRIMNKCYYPDNQMLSRIQQLHNQIRGQVRLIRKIQSLNTVERKNPMLELEQFIFRPSLPDLVNAVRKLSNPRFQQIWGDLQRFQILTEMRKAEELRQRALECLQYEDMFSIDSQNEKKIMTSFENLKIIEVKKQLVESSVFVVNPYQFFQILGLVNEAQIRQKNLRWQIQKKCQQQNENQLITQIKQIINKILEEKPEIGICQYNDVLYNQTLLQLVQEKFALLNEIKLKYFQKHVKRNKKWIEDIQNLKNNVIKYISLEELCCLEFKIKTSIFDHSKLMKQALLPLKYECIQARRYLQQIVPYGKKMLYNIHLKQEQNIYSPQNKFYKKVKQLVVKDFCLRLYERDCQTLRNLIFFQHRVNSKRHSNDLKNLILEFQKLYRNFSPYLHELTLVWEMILNIGQKIFEAFNEDKDSLDDNLLLSMQRKCKKMLKLIQYMVQVGGLGEHRPKFQHIQKVFYRKYEQNQNDSS